MRVTTRYFLLLCPLLLSIGARSEVVFIADTGFIVQNKVRVSSVRELTWKIFTEQVDQWWPADHTWWGESSTLTIDTYAGGCFCEINDDKSAEHMRISFVDPSRLMRMTGGLGPLQGMGMFGALEWTFKAIADGTEVTMRYTVNGISPNGYKELASVVDRVQAVQLGGLKDLSSNSH